MTKPRTKLVSLLLLVLILALLVGGSVSARDTEQQATFVSPILVVNTSFLNVRTGPGVEYTILVTMVGGSELPVLGVAKDRVWYQVATDAGVGWVNVSYTLPRGDFSHVPFASVGQVATANPNAQLGQGGGGVAPTTTVRSATHAWGVSILGGDLRTGPSDDAVKVRTAVGQDLTKIYPLVDQSFNEGRLWFATVVPGIGYVWNEAHQFFLRPMGCYSGDSVIVMVGDAGFAAGPDGAGAVQGVANAGNEYYSLDAREGLVKIEFIDGTTAWVPLEKTQGRSTKNLYPVCDNVPAVTGNTQSNNPNAQNTTVVPAITAAARVVVNTGNLNIRSGPSAGYSVVATVPGGTELAVVGRASDGVWYLVEGSFGQGWLNNQFVLFRGSYSSVPVIDFRNN